MNNLKNKKLVDTMARLRSSVSIDEQTPECSDIDWTIPRHFNAETLCRLTEFGRQLIGSLKALLLALWTDSCEIQVSSITECYAECLSAQINDHQDGSYFLPITRPDKRQVGFIRLPFETCTTFIRQMLCDPEARIGEEGTLSLLEESILQDSVFSIADALLQGLLTSGCQGLKKEEQLIQNVWPVSFTGLEEMFQLSYTIAYEETELELSLFLLDEIVDPLFGIPLSQVSSERLKEMPALITERVKDVGVDVSVGFNPAMMTLQNILTLEKDDIVLLDHKITAPTNVVINQQVGFKAWPAKSAGRWAVVIAGRAGQDND